MGINAVVWPFVCTSFANLCISFEGGNKEPTCNKIFLLELML